MSQEIAESTASVEAPIVAGTKRRLSQNSEQEFKRTRLSPGKKSPLPTEEEPTEGAVDQSRHLSPESKPEEKKEPRRKTAIDDKQRSKRLFGALFSHTNAAGDKLSRRRSEIEQRKKAELKKQDDERVEDRLKRLAKLAVYRQKEQINVDERNLRTRHENLLDQAQSLKTRAEPHIYYRPWELSNAEEDRVADQVDDVRDLIKGELAEFERKKEERLKALENPPLDEGTDKNLKSHEKDVKSPSSRTEASRVEDPKSSAPPDGEDHGPDPDEVDKPSQSVNPTEPDERSLHQTSAEINETQDSALVEPAENSESTHIQPTHQEAKEDQDDEADHMVEGDEDDVIY